MIPLPRLAGAPAFLLLPVLFGFMAAGLAHAAWNYAVFKYLEKAP